MTVAHNESQELTKVNSITDQIDVWIEDANWKLNGEENLTKDYLEKKSWECWKKIEDDSHYQLLELKKQNIENNPLYLEFKKRLSLLYDEQWTLESHIEWGIASLEEDIAVHGRFDEEHWAARRLSELNRLPTQERIEKIIQANKEFEREK